MQPQFQATSNHGVRGVFRGSLSVNQAEDIFWGFSSLQKKNSSILCNYVDKEVRCLYLFIIICCTSNIARRKRPLSLSSDVSRPQNARAWCITDVCVNFARRRSRRSAPTNNDRVEQTSRREREVNCVYIRFNVPQRRATDYLSSVADLEAIGAWNTERRPV